MKKIIACVMLSCVLGGACASAHADTFRDVVIKKSHFNSDEEYSREEWEKNTITRENKINGKGYLCVGKDGHLCYSYSKREQE